MAWSMGHVSDAVATCPCLVDGLDSPCFSDLNERGEACLCVETALLVEAAEAGDSPSPLPS